MTSLTDIIGVFFVLSAAIGATAFIGRSNDRGERRLLAVSLTMHIVFSLTIMYLQTSLYQESDLWFYVSASTPLLQLMSSDPFYFGWQLIRATFRLSNEIGVVDGSSTSTMITALALARYFTADSLWSCSVGTAALTFFAKWGMYAVFRDELRRLSRRSLATAALCFPSVVFWSSSILKESYAMIGLSALFYGSRRLIRGEWVFTPLVIVGASLVALFKPYILFPFVVGVAAWLVFERSSRAFKYAPIYVFVGAVVGLLLILGLSALFPDFAPTKIVEHTADAQARGVYAEGGSFYAMGPQDATATGQLLYAPLAFVTAISRPWPWEFNNATSFIAAVEMALLTLLLIRALLKGGMTGLVGAFSVPTIVFAITFVLIGGTAIGLATLNFGTLSRYRAPIMPFYAVLVVHLSQYADAVARERRENRRSREVAKLKQLVMGSRARSPREEGT